MQVSKDVKRAIKLIKRVLKGRRAHSEVTRLLSRRGPLPAQHFRIGVYFADSDVNLYQIRQWYAPLQALAKRWPVLILARNAAGAQQMLMESALDVAFVPKVADLEQIVLEQPLDIILYVNQNTRNFQMMRYAHRWHVFINHGESDKMYMTSNQHKAYDVAFVAGDAARARLSRALWDYDTDTRTMPIGRPQTDHLAGEAPYPDDGRTVVLYAPTWEGDRPTAAYGSIVTHGEQLVRELLATGRHRIVYRPHPRSGVADAAYGEANRRIIEMLETANRANADAHHVVDRDPMLGWQLQRPDVAVCDISAMVYDRLATGKPLMVTWPVAPEADVDQGGYLGVCEWLHAEQTDDIARVLDGVMGDAEAQDRLGTWSERYFGDTRPGAPTQRFHDAIAELLERSTRWKERDPSRADRVID